MPAGGSRQTLYRFLELIGWMVAACAGAIMITQVFGWTGLMPVAVIQSLTPYLGLLLAPVALVALWSRRLHLATACGAIGLGILLLAAPLAYPDHQHDPIADAVGLRVASLNLLHTNDRIDDVVTTLDDLAPDVIVFNEYTAEHQSTLQGSALTDDYRYRIDRTDQYAGVALWSREPVTVAEPPDTYYNSLDVTVDGPDGDIRLVAIHVPTPLISFENWQRDLHTVGRIGRGAATPTMVVGDLNSSYWHPDFRDLLDAGFVDAHIANDAGFSSSWPADKAVPAFVRLDHALTIGGLVSTDVADFEIPGSDHRGFVVTVAPTP